jgi:RNA polymerase sigma-70 factor (ECF subfamily)
MDFTGTTYDDEQRRGEDAFKAIFDAHYPRLVLFADSFLLSTSAAEDIVQTIFTDLWQSGRWQNPSLAIQAYLYAAVRNRCLNEIRHQNVRDTHNIRYVQAMLNVWDDGEDGAAMLEALRRCISRLPEQVRRTIELRYFQNKSVAETAAVLHVSENTVKTHLKRGRATLKLSLGDVRLKIFLALVTLFAE